MFSTKCKLNLNQVYCNILAAACANSISIYFIMFYCDLIMIRRAHQRLHLPRDMQLSCGIELFFGGILS